jgi:hypothetical protein
MKAGLANKVADHAWASVGDGTMRFITMLALAGGERAL